MSRKIVVKGLAVLAGIFMMVTFSAFNASAQDAPVPKTGQTLCYNSLGTVISCAGSGQDGEYLKGVA